MRAAKSIGIRTRGDEALGLLGDVGTTCAYGANGSFASDEQGRTSVAGKYVAGDVSRDVQLAIVAAAVGTRAALALNKDLLRRDDLI
jgi:thioredoxin reductase